MPVTLARWQKYERRRWMRRMHVLDCRVIYRQGFVLSTVKKVAVTREYLLSDGRIFFEQYAYWQTSTVLDVVMNKMAEVSPERYACRPSRDQWR